MQTKPVLPNDWLHCLGRHRIFEASQKDTQNVHQTFSNQANTSRVMTLRGNDLILAVGSQIRVLSLNEVKDAWISAAPRFSDAGLSAFSDLNWLLDVPYRTLDTPSIDFIIESITLNNNGSLLVAQGKHKIVVVCISRRGAKGIKDLVVGKNMYGKDLGVLKCAWHPLSETDTHLVVLSSDSYLRIFDVNVNVDQEEQKFDLSPTPRGKTSTGGGFSPDDDFDEQEEAVSFALGKPSIDDCGTWELFTVYYTLRNGHIYAMCPILPCRSVIRRKHLELLGCMIEAKTQKLLEKLTEQDDDENEDNRLLYYLLRMQSAWITNVLQIAKPLDENFLLVSFTGPLFKFSIQRQGPFRTEAPTESDGQVADMMLMPNDPVMIMVVAYTNGNIHHYILGSVIEPQWLVRGRRSQENWRNQLRRFQSSTELLPEALLYEIISINTSRRQPITLAVDPLYHDTYYVYHPRGVHQIVTKKWIDKLKDLYKRQAAGKTDATELMSAWIAEDIPSNVKCLVEKSASDSEPLIGLVVLSDIYLTYSLLTLSRSYSLISKDLPFQSAESLEIGSPLSKSPKDQNDEAPFYTSPLATEPFKLTESLKTGQSTMAKLAIPKGIDGKKEIVVNEETLRFLFTVSEKYCYNIRELSKSTNVLEYRLKAQEKVLQHQIFMAQDLLNRFQVYMSNDAHDERAQRVLEATNKYAKLALRIDGVLRKMLAVYEPQLSPQEKEWIQGLEDIERKVQGENGYLKRIERLRAQLNRMKLNTEWQAALPASKCRISSTELDAFKKSLDKQTLEMNEAKQRVNALQQCLK